MEDQQIIALLWQRSEEAIAALNEKFGTRLQHLSRNILSSDADAQECVNDTYLALWNAIPPERPESLKAYISRIVRNIAYNKTKANNTWKRRASFLTVGEEFLETIPDTADLAEQFEAARAGEIINEFLETLPAHERQVFVLRYYFGESVADVAEDMDFSVSKVKSLLMRTRNRLADRLGKEGIIV